MKDSAVICLEDESYLGGEDSFFTSLIGDTGGGEATYAALC
jgi:hypothetical protein